MFVCELAGNDLDWERLTQCQTEARDGSYEKALAGYLQWLAGQRDSIESWFQQKVAEYRASASQSAAHRRTPDTVAHLAVGLRAFLRFARSCEVLSKDEAAAMWNRFWSALGVVAQQQGEHQRSEEPAARFMELLSALLSSGAAHLADAKDGWTRHDIRGRCIGWLDGDLVYLEPDAAFAAVQRFAREQGDALSVSTKTLWKRMKDQGLLARHDKDRNLFTAPVDGVRRRVLAIHASKLPVDPVLRGHGGRYVDPEESFIEDD